MESESESQEGEILGSMQLLLLYCTTKRERERKRFFLLYKPGQLQHALCMQAVRIVGLQQAIDISIGTTSPYSSILCPAIAAYLSYRIWPTSCVHVWLKKKHIFFEEEE